MSRADKNHLSHLIINLILATMLIIASILILSQTLINIKYNYSKNKKILSEKLVYEQFSIIFIKINTFLFSFIFLFFIFHIIGLLISTIIIFTTTFLATY